ncbi:AAA family ATPase [Salinifilum ghardaiensis]
MFQDRGFYVLDEPEAALSFASCLQLVGLMHELGERRAQVVCATHSPILAAAPMGLAAGSGTSSSSLTTGGGATSTTRTAT